MDQPEASTNFYFKLSLHGDEAIFQEVSGLGPDEVTKYTNLVLKRGILPPSSQLAGWFKQALESNLQKAVKTYDLELRLMNADDTVLAVWTFYKAWPVKWSLSEFKSSDADELVVETLEFAYSHFTKNV